VPCGGLEPTPDTSTVGCCTAQGEMLQDFLRRPRPVRGHVCRYCARGKCCRIFCGAPDPFVATSAVTAQGEMLQDFLRRPGPVLCSRVPVRYTPIPPDRNRLTASLSRPNLVYLPLTVCRSAPVRSSGLSSFASSVVLVCSSVCDSASPAPRLWLLLAYPSPRTSSRAVQRHPEPSVFSTSPARQQWNLSR